ncbi:hypothetical protein O3G_MSEX010793 [Manduca sexta]|uniref:Uncharacterized protein n=1 Tax=Manduca sexta TaxID=7130 RepID=A0A922CUE7_MANSE|nr:hypothetical protein O3G_MSEX010793 [Manduca sexta]
MNIVKIILALYIHKFIKISLLIGLASDTARRIYASFPFPDSELDICLLYLDSPFESVEKLINESLAQEYLKGYEPWLHKTIHTFLYGNSYAKWADDVASPTRMFIVAGVLPSAALIIFFLFILFYTRPKNKKSFRVATRV